MEGLRGGRLKDGESGGGWKVGERERALEISRGGGER